MDKEEKREKYIEVICELKKVPNPNKALIRDVQNLQCELIDVEQLTDIHIADIEPEQAPKFCDANIDEAKIFDEPLLDYELDYINENYPDFVYERVMNQIH